MTTSSAHQREADSSTAALLPESGEFSLSSASAGGNHNDGQLNISSAKLAMPNFGGDMKLYAVAARRAGRINANNISDAEHQSLLKERQRLLDKKFNETITRSEINKLEYVRWSLDRIEDAKHGESLDVLENAISQYELFASNVQKLEGQFSQFIRHPR